MSKSILKTRKKSEEPRLFKPRRDAETETESSSSVTDEYPETEHSKALDLCKQHPSSCKCQERYVKIKKSSTKRVVVSKKSCWDADELTMRRQKIEMQLSHSQLEEALSAEKHHVLRMRFERTEDVATALLLYLDCLELEEKASYGLCRQLNGLIVNEKSIFVTEQLSAIVKGLVEDAELKEAFTGKENLRNLLGSDERVEDLMLEYGEKKKDFQTASQNFKILLQNASLNVAQLEKLQRQFDGILLGFQHSRCMLDQELPHVIAKRMEVLVSSFNELGRDLEKIAADRTDMSSLLKHLEASLRNCNDLGTIKGDLREEALVGGAIMCSNCSRSPAIAGD